MDFFTVKHVRSDGTEGLWPTRHVEVTRRGEGSDYDDRIVIFVDVSDEARPTIKISDGSVFVMNGTGRTVSTYRLGPAFRNVTPIQPRKR